jgi:iron complex outermembrane receptor protein
MISGRIIFSLFITFPSLSAIAQSNCRGVLSGKVQDQSGAKIVGATVGIPESAQGTMTDNAGLFRLEKICRGRVNVSIHSLGYQDNVLRITFDDDSTHVIVTLKQTSQQLKEVLVQDHAMATDYAQNYALLREAQLAESAGKTLGESLKEIPGVNTIQTGPGIFKPVIHGVHSQRILILNYGIRQEGQQWGAEHAPEIDPFIASDIIVIKDASAIKYGTDALGGVIVVNPPPLPERNELSGSVNTIFQSNGRSGTISALLEGGLGKLKGWGWRVQGSAKGTGDFHTPDYSLTNTGVRELNYSVATGYHEEKFGVDAYFSHFNTTLGILRGTAVNNIEDLESAMEREIPLYTAPFSYEIHEPRQEVQHDLAKVNGHLKSGNHEWHIQYGYQKNHRQEFDFRPGNLSDVPALNLKLTTHTLEAEVETSITEKQSWSVGLTGMFQKNSKVDGIQRIPFIPNFSNSSAGVFAISKFHFKNLSIDVGARYDYRYYSVSGYDYKNSLFQSESLFHNPSATAGATLSLKNNQTVILNVSSAWRPPTVAELYSLGTHQSAASIEYGLLLNKTNNEVLEIDAVNFKTEQALKWVGTYQVQLKAVNLSVSPYVNYIFNYIYLRPDGIASSLRGPAPAFRYTQTDARFIGIDFSGVWQAGKYLKVSPLVSLLNASDKRNDDYLVFIPSNRYEMAIRYERDHALGLKNVFIETKLRYIDEQHRAPRTIQPSKFIEASENGDDPLEGSDDNFDFMDAPPGYLLLNIAAGVAIPGEQVRYDFRIASENILNTRYREYTNRFRYFADDLGRNFILSIKCIF